MITLMIHNSEQAALNATSFGGKPVKNKESEFQWPLCSCCELPMQFLAKILVDSQLHQIFMCQNDPGLCDEWDANEGGNAVAVTTPTDLEVVKAPSKGITLRETEHSAQLVEVAADNYEMARTEWAQSNSVSSGEVLGQLFGEPSWIQGDETPHCNQCSQPMKFVAQLEQGPDWSTAMNFGGGGAAYLFRCSCIHSAKFLWQC